MKSNLPLKLGIGIIVVFGLLHVGFVLYEPMWYKIQEWRLQSDAAATRNAAAASVAGKGGRAMPYIRRWLTLQNEKIVIGACLAIKHMPPGPDYDSMLKGLLPEFGMILDGLPGKKTDAVSAILSSTFINIDYESAYKKYPRRIAIIKSFFLLNPDFEDDDFPAVEAYDLGYLGDPVAVEPLNRALLKYNRDEEEARCAILEVLTWFGDERSIGPIISVMETDTEKSVHAGCAVALAQFDVPEARRALINQKKKGSNSAAIALYWMDGKGLDDIDTEALIYEFEDELLHFARIRWGNSSSICTGEFVWRLIYQRYRKWYFIKEIIKILPEGFPHTAPVEDLDEVYDKSNENIAWIIENKNRIAWDAEKCRYFLRNGE